MAGVLFDASAICAGFSIGFASALAAAKKPGGEGGMASNSFQNEVPKTRINITLDLHTGSAQKKVELPLKLMVMGD